MALVRLIYASTLTEGVDATELDNVLTHSRIHNQKKYISGILWFNRNYIIQALEGSPETVNALYIKITQDPRHTSVNLLDYKLIKKREFSSWSMGYVAETKETKEILLAYYSDAQFNPYGLLGEPAISFLRDLSHHIAKE